MPDNLEVYLYYCYIIDVKNWSFIPKQECLSLSAATNQYPMPVYTTQTYKYSTTYKYNTVIINDTLITYCQVSKILDLQTDGRTHTRKEDPDND